MDDTIGGLLRGQSPAMAELLRQLHKVATTDLTVLIIGESGSGKEAVATALHLLSPRRDHPFIPVNCAAIAPSLVVQHFEHAQGGTLLLDEITEMPPDAQVALLRTLENAPGVRILASTHRNIDEAMRSGRFREDLMYRLAVFPLRVPPLRERGADIELLARHFLDELNARESAAKNFSRPCLQQLMAYAWPGNVRELKNIVSRAFILADQIIDAPFTQAMPPHPRPARRDGQIEVAVGTPLAEVQRSLIEATLDHFAGDKRAAAATLGVSLKTLYNRLELYRGSDSPMQ